MTTDAFGVPGVDALFDAELSDFIATRDALVKERKAQGDKEGAAAVKALRKPSTVAWGVNRVVRTNRDAISDVIEAGAAVRAAQVKAVQGDGAALRDASKAWRAQVNALAAQVGKLIGEQYRDDAAATFEAASIDDALGEVMRNGRFTAAVEAAGFGLAGMPEVPVKPIAAMQPVDEAVSVVEDAVDEGAVDEARDELARLETKVEKTLHSLRRAEQRLDQAREAVDDARLTYEETLARRDKAARSLKDLTS